MAATIYWYDFETFGADPRRDRACQFAGLRTDEELNPVGEPLVLYCRAADDFLPSPSACAITGITPRQANARGLAEAEFIRRIHDEFSVPQTCVAGYNNIRFDDELGRQLLYRNFFDPYAREWRSGNSRWDIIDMLRLCAAARPEGIQWPQKEDGSASFRLERLSAANGIEHADAHDALADVMATIAMARLVKEKQPKLYEYVYRLRDKQRVRAEIDLDTRKPVLHVSVRYPASRGCLALVIPLCEHPEQSNGVVVYDLREDPASWRELGVEEIRERVFTPVDALPDGVSRVPLKVLHTNRCPVITSPAVLQKEQAERYGIDLDRCRAHWESMQGDQALAAKAGQVFSNRDSGEKITDPDFMIYSGGFFPDSDRSLMDTVRATPPAELGRMDLPFRDSRLKTMLFRYRARNYPETLGAEERTRWDAFRRERLLQGDAVARFDRELEQVRQKENADNALLDELQDYRDGLLQPLMP